MLFKPRGDREDIKLATDDFERKAFDLSAFGDNAIAVILKKHRGGSHASTFIPVNKRVMRDDVPRIERGLIKNRGV